MPSVASEAKHVAVLDLPQRAVAFRTYKHRKVAETIFIRHGRVFLSCDRRLQPDSRWNRKRLPGGLGGQPGQQVAHSGDRHAMVDFDMALGAPNHVWYGRVLRVLDHCYSADGLDRPETRGAVGQAAREEDANDPSSIATCGRPKERINRGPGEILARAAPEQHMIVVQQQMETGGSHIDPPPLELLPTLRLGRPERASPIKDLRKIARLTHVEHHEDSSGKIGR